VDGKRTTGESLYSPDSEFEPEPSPSEGEADSIVSLPQQSTPHSRIYDFHSRFDTAGFGMIDIAPHWSVPWSDLMMVMMVMFAVMFVTQMAERDVGQLFKDPGKFISGTQPTAPRLDATAAGQIPVEEILRLSERLVAQANLEDIDVVLTDNQAVKVSVRGNLLFDLGKADLKPESISFLDRLSQIIAANNYQIEIVGHTDNFPISNPSYPTNWELSSARAARVGRYLIQSGKLEPGRFTVIGHSFYRPSAPNDTLDNKARNRRVEIIITRNEYKP
jgi:chemotaxis protein MotB